MSALIEQKMEELAQKEELTSRRDLKVNLSSKAMVNQLLEAWGNALKSSAAAPSYRKIEDLIADLDATPSELTLLLDSTQSGVLEFTMSDDQKALINAFLEDLEALSLNAQVDSERMIAAKESFKRKESEFYTVISFDKENAKEKIESFAAWGEDFTASYKDPDYGSLEVEDLYALSIMFPRKPLTPEEEEALRKEYEEEVQKANKKYKNFNQIVKANDVEALKKIIADTKEVGYWDEAKKESLAQLIPIIIDAGALDCLKIFADEEIPLDTLYGSGALTTFQLACMKNKPEIMEFLLTKGADINESGIRGLSPLMLAAESDAPEAIEKLIQLGVDINETCLEKRTALFYAAIGPDGGETAEKAVRKLMDFGADPTIYDLSNNLAEEMVSEDEKFNQLFEDLKQYTDDFKAGKINPRKSQGLVSRARSILGF